MPTRPLPTVASSKATVIDKETNVGDAWHETAAFMSILSYSRPFLTNTAQGQEVRTISSLTLQNVHRRVSVDLEGFTHK